MAYKVLALKWRPRAFSEMVGQENVLRALTHALDSGRIHHAFLFTGTRGVGKTTVARILAKSLNCEQGITARPCCVCAACKEIEEGRFVDLIEVDAASRTKVEETRELLENVQYTPTFGRYKVYLIDEVHMFSKSSFNAILKTLEEPPPHVKFLLATTDPQKLPVTILSRCLQFNLRSLPLPIIRDRMVYILEAEGIPFEDTALRELARGADGSMRDGLSLLDQAIAYGGGKVMTEDVYAMLGTLSWDVVYALLEGLAAGDASVLMTTVGTLAERTPDWNALLGDMVGLLQRIALAQFVPEAVDDHVGDRERILALAKRMTVEEVQLHYQIALLGRRDLALAPDPRSGFEMVLLRMLAFRPLTEEGAEVRAGTRSAAPPHAPSASSQAAPVPAAPMSVVEPKRADPPTPMAVPAAPVSLSEVHWPTLVARLGLGGFNHQLAMHCSLQRVEENTLHLTLEKIHRSLLNKTREQYIEAAVQQEFGSNVRVAILVMGDVATATASATAVTPAQIQEIREQERMAAAQRSIARDPCVQALQQTFEATLVDGSIRPHDG